MESVLKNNTLAQLRYSATKQACSFLEREVIVCGWNSVKLSRIYSLLQQCLTNSIHWIAQRTFERTDFLLGTLDALQKLNETNVTIVKNAHDLAQNSFDFDSTINPDPNDLNVQLESIQFIIT